MDQDNKIIGQEIIDQINVAIETYRQQDHMEKIQTKLSPFKFLSRKLLMQKGVLTKEDIITSYMAEMKKDLKKNMGIDMPYNMSIYMAIRHLYSKRVTTVDSPRYISIHTFL